MTGINGLPVGLFSFDPGAEFDYLAEGETATVSFSYEITDSNGDISQATVTLIVSGSYDGPIITSAASDAMGNVVEAGAEEDGTVIAGTVEATGTLAATGVLTAADPDANATASWSGGGSGTYGDFAITAGGVWTYLLNNTLIATQA